MMFLPLFSVAEFFTWGSFVHRDFFGGSGGLRSLQGVREGLGGFVEGLFLRKGLLVYIDR